MLALILNVSQKVMVVGMSDDYNKPKSQGQLMLKDTEYERILHGEYPKTLESLIQYLDGLDFVVEEWLESLHFFPKTCVIRKVRHRSWM